MGDKIDTVNKSTLIVSSKKVGLEVNVYKTKYVLLSHHRNACEIKGMYVA
jgi:hypothetical protein